MYSEEYGVYLHIHLYYIYIYIIRVYSGCRLVTGCIYVPILYIYFIENALLYLELGGVWPGKRGRRFGVAPAN